MKCPECGGLFNIGDVPLDDLPESFTWRRRVCALWHEFPRLLGLKALSLEGFYTEETMVAPMKDGTVDWESVGGLNGGV